MRWEGWEGRGTLSASSLLFEFFSPVELAGGGGIQYIPSPPYVFCSPWASAVPLLFYSRGMGEGVR